MKKVVVQMGDSDPMEMPVGGTMGARPGRRRAVRPVGRRRWSAGGGGRRAHARRPLPEARPQDPGRQGDASRWPAGSFADRALPGRGPARRHIDYWLAKDAGPFGLVKLEVGPPGGPDEDDGGKRDVELAARGKGAKPELTKPAKPFDPEAMRARFGGGGRRQLARRRA